jgi:RHS repeat-associated protein
MRRAGASTRQSSAWRIPGNRISSVHQYAYDAEGRLITLNGAATPTYVYDADGLRVRGPAYEYLYDVAGHAVTLLDATSGTWAVGEVFAGGRHLATYAGGAGGTTYFAHADHIGTERVRTTMSAAQCETLANLPFGDLETKTGNCDPSARFFTGKERDPETGLDYFGARYYGSGTGTWLSPDWANGAAAVPYANFSNPQTLNLYGYVGNNPIGQADADGHQDKKSPDQGGDLVRPSCAGGSEVVGCSISAPRESAELQQAKQDSAQQQTPQNPQQEPLSNVVENETSSLRPNPNAQPGQPGSAEDLANGRQAIAEIANRVRAGGHPGQVAPDTLYDSEAAGLRHGDPAALNAHSASEAAAAAALAGSNISNGALKYRTRVGTNVRTAVGRSRHNRGTPVSQHYGPFMEGHHRVVIVVAP